MSFISFEYIAFFCVVFVLYFSLSLKRRWILLLVASYFFYAFSRVEYILLIGFSTLVDYVLAQAIHQTSHEQRHKRLMLLSTSIGVNMFVLGFFKYFNFFSQSLAVFFESVGLPYQPPIAQFPATCGDLILYIPVDGLYL